MPNKANAKKALRQSYKRYKRNKSVLDNIKYLLRKRRHSLTEKKFQEAQDITKKLVSALDKAAQKKIIKKNTAARKKSRILKSLHKAMAHK